MAATILVTASNKAEEQKKAKSLQFLATLSVQELDRLEQMAKSTKARGMLNENWSLLQTMI